MVATNPDRRAAVLARRHSRRSSVILKPISLIGLGGLLVAGIVLPATAKAESSHHTTTLAVYGDSPYGVNPTDSAQVVATPAFIDSINRDPNVSRVIHVGDIHSGKSYCTEAYDRTVLGLWQAFQDPLVYTPGDNEWTDCHKTGEGGGKWNATTQQIDYVKNADGTLADYAGGDPIANLQLVRSLFFSKPGNTLGQRTEEVISQSKVYDRHFPADKQFVENVMWENDGVVYVTVNIPGGSNNDKDTWFGTPTMSAAQSQEIADRTGADLRWIDAGFAFAKSNDSKAIVILEQADMWDFDGKPASHLTEYKPFVQHIADGALAFKNPVLLFNGDSHTYKSDNPLALTDPQSTIHNLGVDVPNFHRVVVHGSTTPLEWLRVTVDPEASNATTGTSFGPFSWERMIQP
jgi:hypothetical protein